MPRRPLRRVAILAINPWNHDGDLQPYSYAAHRLLAALPGDVDARVFDGAGWDVDTWVETVLAWGPDLVGASTYVWSLPVFLPVLDALRARDPGLTIVMGGPSARPAMLRQAPFSALLPVIDAVVAGDGEVPFRALLDRPIDEVPGLWFPNGRSTPAPTRVLDGIVSPLRAGLAPPGKSHHLQTFLGCPMSCSFCAWGDEKESPTFSEAWLVAELEALGPDVPSVFSVDAGLNLNRAALRNLRAAADRTGALDGRRFYAQLYPSWYGPDVENLLARTHPLTTIGLQSVDAEMLRGIGRRAAASGFERVLDQASAHGEVTVELIVGLPGDTLPRFLDTLRYALGLGVALRIYYCLVLPDALMTRGGWSDRLRWDPISLELLEGPGWPAHDLVRVRAILDEAMAEHGGYATTQWPRVRDDHTVALGRMPPASMWVLPARTGVRWPEARVQALAAGVAGRLRSARLVEVVPAGADVEVVLAAADGEVRVRVRSEADVDERLRPWC